MNSIKIFILACLLSGNTYFAHASEPIIFSDTSKILPVRGSIMVLEDKSSQLTVHDVMLSKDFQSATQSVPNLGISTSSFWLKFDIINNTSAKKLLLELTNPILDEVDYYSIVSNGKLTSSKMGEIYPFNSRKYKYQHYVFDLNVATGEMATCLIRVKCQEEIIVPLQIGLEQTVYEENLMKDSLFGVYCGILLIMFFYNLVLYFSFRDRSYLYYVAHTLFVGLTQATILGYSYKFLWPNSLWIAEESIYLFTCMVSLVGIEFLKSFLRTKEFTPVLHKLLHPFTATYLICILLSAVGLNSTAYQIMQITQGLVTLFILYIAIRISLKGYHPARFYLLSRSLFMIGIFIYVMKDFGILPYNNFTIYSMTAGSAIEVVLLSFALADRINILKREKEESQARALEASIENERIIKEQNVILETKVKERTNDLEVANQELKTTYDDLRSTQSQLVDAEKMASLGQLTAGIAHEMNNPINFIASNVSPLKKDISDIITLLERYDKLSGAKDVAKELKEIERLKKELDTDYLKEEVHLLLKSIDEGAVRTADIINSLRTFSRLDEDDLKDANINDGIRATIKLLHSKLNGKITLEEHFEDLPDIECFPGKLNQVFMNLLDNAIYAINKKMNGSEKGLISINTSTVNSSVIINIKDNGIGMNEEVMKKIFEPFFTTKDVGDGTGLGLSISYSIVDNHNGKMNVVSKEGIGSEFEITIPISQN